MRDYYDLVIAHEEYMDTHNTINKLCNYLDDSIEKYTYIEHGVNNNIETEMLREPFISLGFSNEEFNISVEEDKHSLLARIAEVIREVYETLTAAFVALYKRVSSSVDIISDSIEELIPKVEELDSEHSTKYLTEEDINKIYNSFGTIIRSESGIDTNEELCRLILKAGQSISTPKLTQPLTNIIQTTLPRINIEKIVFSTEVMTKACRGGIGINNEINSYFFKNLPDQVRETTSKDNVIVVEYYGNRCAGMLSQPGKFHYVKGLVNYSPKLTAFKETPSKTSLLNVLRMVKGLCVRLDGYKSLVNNDIDSGKKIIHNFNKVDRVIDENNNGVETFNSNMSLIKEFASAIPKIGNANMANYYLFIRNITHYCSMCYEYKK